MPTPEKPNEVKPKKKAAPTEYVLLVKLGAAENWQQQKATIKAVGKDAAIKQQIAIGAEGSVTYFALSAVPASSWQPVKPKTTTKTITTLEAL